MKIHLILSLSLSLALSACFSGNGEINTRGQVVSYDPASLKTVDWVQELPEGNYDVSVVLGDRDSGTVNWVKAEGRRQMLDRVVTRPGSFVSKSFTVNIRTNDLQNGGKVGMRGSEGSFLRWDNKLTLSVITDYPDAVKISVTPNPSAVTVFLAGDSTVTDQTDEPWASWGLLIPEFFDRGVAVANHAESGLTLSAFRSQRRLQKCLETMKKGDYVLIQFGHNDQKEKGADAGPFKSYKKNLEMMIADVRSKGGNPVVITPVERRRFDSDGKPFKTLEEYADACKQVAAEQNVPLIDLSAMSFAMYGVFGAEASKSLFVYDGNTKDDTHHCVFGGYELARCVIEGIRSGVPGLARLIRSDVPVFDPLHPDTLETVRIPPSSSRSLVKPAGD